jgi:uncharacterized protein YbjT (DUF2867 family)
MLDKYDKLILVTGATGHQGGAVARRLIGEGWRVRALTRDPSKLSARALSTLEAEVVKGDLGDPSSIRNALIGVYGVFAVFTPFEEGMEAEIRQGKTLANAAKAAGVRHYVYSSVVSADRKTGIPHFETKKVIEDHIRAIGLPATVLRPAWFFYNFGWPMFKDSIMDGELHIAIKPGMPLQMIAVEDFAGFVADAFDNPDNYIGKTMELAGDELTMEQTAEVMGRVIGRKVRYVNMPIEQVRSMNEDMARMYEWMNEVGYSVDIDSLKKLRPDMLDLESWLRKSGWEKVALKAA